MPSRWRKRKVNASVSPFLLSASLNAAATISKIIRVDKLKGIPGRYISSGLNPSTFWMERLS